MTYNANLPIPMANEPGMLWPAARFQLVIIGISLLLAIPAGLAGFLHGAEHGAEPGAIPAVPGWVWLYSFATGILTTLAAAALEQKWALSDRGHYLEGPLARKFSHYTTVMLVVPFALLGLALVFVLGDLFRDGALFTLGLGFLWLGLFYAFTYWLTRLYLWLARKALESYIAHSAASRH